MPPKLYLYKASHANIVAILRKGKGRSEWELIKWDLDTDTFQDGQWLLRKQVDADSAAISPYGDYFAYGYDIYGLRDWESVGVVSKLPNFTAEYFAKFTGGRVWYSPRFDPINRLVNHYINQNNNKEPFFEKRNLTTKLEEVQLTQNHLYADPGYMGQSFTDPKGRRITSIEGKLFADGELIYDTTNHVFREVKPID